MHHDVVMPRMGQGMEEGRVVRWLKAVGARVERGQELVEIETDKSVAVVESAETGTLVQITVTEGQTVPVGTVIAVIDDGQPPPLKGGRTGLGTPPIAQSAKQAARPTALPARIDASPVARRIAAEHGIDLSQIHGTGPGGRITKDDVEAALSLAPSALHPTLVGAAVEQDAHSVSLSRIRQTAARRMVESKSTAPHFYVSTEIDMGRALALRDSRQGRDIAISINDLILRAATLALLQFPHLNATFAGSELLIHAHINLAVAVALDEGLITPVIHNCETLGLADLALAARKVIDNARSGRLRPAELEGGTLTVTNLGMFGVTHFHPIINPPQAAILAVGSVRRVPVFDEHDRLLPAQLLTATVSADHRVTDGVEVARFLQELKRLLEDAFALL